eukprot:TRINITY_DN7895_c1_g2_i3.p2 TRINITY_DN7895_c1_g2~~TRINITY_DN7895_c1_g2_i3.p2  ORF type:complete len:118 (+),score=6.93 TRINITY_DN7895_c1_g2_i3:440-793(+)
MMTTSMKHVVQSNAVDMRWWKRVVHLHLGGGRATVPSLAANVAASLREVGLFAFVRLSRCIIRRSEAFARVRQQTAKQYLVVAENFICLGDTLLKVTNWLSLQAQEPLEALRRMQEM